MKTLMFSDQWFEKFREKINSNQDYERYAADWDGDIVISIRGDNQSSYAVGRTETSSSNFFMESATL